ncbi:uncharacterized protein LOC113469054 [Diaphorina citri]|uniref:Uncharacterized protein LOC113469054 n=1 Tax=Diaphorina citri TaxID=121845 RepID=A0A3Q0J1E0_DIACI|nr:uncharacterized protein LOC113469054 [Diaphorina citri]
MAQSRFLATVIATSSLLLEEEDKDKNQQEKCRTVWVRDWISKRDTEGCYGKLLVELQNEEPQLYKNFLRMSYNDFCFLLDMVTPLIKKKDTNMRKSISPGERVQNSGNAMHKRIRPEYPTSDGTLNTAIDKMLELHSSMKSRAPLQTQQYGTFTV